MFYLVKETISKNFFLQACRFFKSRQPRSLGVEMPGQGLLWLGHFVARRLHELKWCHKFSIFFSSSSHFHPPFTANPWKQTQQNSLEIRGVGMGHLKLAIIKNSAGISTFIYLIMERLKLSLKQENTACSRGLPCCQHKCCSAWFSSVTSGIKWF